MAQMATLCHWQKERHLSTTPNHQPLIDTLFQGCRGQDLRLQWGSQSSWICRPESIRDSTSEGWNRTKNWHYQWASRGFCCRWSRVQQHHFKYRDPPVLMLPESWPSGHGAGDLAKGAERLLSIFSQFVSNSKSPTVSFQCRDEVFFPSSKSVGHVWKYLDFKNISMNYANVILLFLCFYLLLLKLCEHQLWLRMLFRRGWSWRDGKWVGSGYMMWDP